MNETIQHSDTNLLRTQMEDRIAEMQFCPRLTLGTSTISCSLWTLLIHLFLLDMQRVKDVLVTLGSAELEDTPKRLARVEL